MITKKVIANITLLPKFNYSDDIINFLTQNWNCLIILGDAMHIPENADCVMIYEQLDSKVQMHSLRHILILNEQLRFDDEFDRLIHLQPNGILIRE